MRNRKFLTVMAAMAMVSVSLGYGLVFNAGAGSFMEDIEGPNATFRDVIWNDNGTSAYVVGNDSASNGVVYTYTAENETWSPLSSVPGDSYNAISKVDPYVWSDDVESGENGWAATGTGEVAETNTTLIGEWKFNEGVGTIVNDTSGNDHPGTRINSVDGSWIDDNDWVDGMSGKALKFNGVNNSVAVNNVAGLTNGSFTGQCWVNISTHEAYSGIVNKYGSGGWGIWDQADGGIRFYRNDGSTSNSNDATPISTNEWHHIAWSYNASSGFASFYIDGNLDYSVPSVNPLRTVTPMTIGKYGGSYYLDGQIDEVQIYNRALTPKEISDYYNETMNKVGEWKFDEGAGTLANDTSQHDNNGTLNFMAASDWVDGVSGDALYFDGANKFVDCGNDSSLDLPLEFTIEAWVNTASIGDYQAIVSKATDNSVAGISYSLLLGTTGEPLIYLSDGTTNEFQYGTTALEANTWNHIAVVATSTEFRFYLNGQPDGGAVHTITPQVNTANLRIGTKDMTPEQYFNGTIDEVNIWNYSLSASDILDNYNDGWDNYLQEQTKVGDWKLDEGTGSLASDDSQYGNDGILTNMEEADWVAGVSGDALLFDGVNEYVNISDDPSLNMTEFTIEAWIKLTNLGKWQGVVAKAIANAVGSMSYHVRISTANLVQVYIDDGAATSYAFGNTALSANTWYHIAVTANGTEFKFYLNGQPDGQAVQSVIPQFVAAPLKIGSHANTQYFDGAIDEVKIYKRILNATEIFDSYNSFIVVPDWQVVDPSTLPIPGSGISHGSANSGSNIWWFGNNATGNYDAGARAVGSLISPVTYLPSSSTMGRLNFSHWFDVEPGNPGMDQMTVSIKNTSDIGWTQLRYWDSDSTPISNWSQEMVDITGWLGNDVQVNFTFDSVDGNNNDFAGWHIDDISFYTDDVYVVVGNIPSGAGYSAYSMDNYGNMKNISGMNTIGFQDVAGGSTPASFLAVGGNSAYYWDGKVWNSLTGINPGDGLRGVEFNGTHFFIVGHDSTGQGKAFYITQSNLDADIFNLVAIANPPSEKLNAIDWSNYVNGGLVSAEGAVYLLDSSFTWLELEGDNATVNYTAASWNPGGSRAIIVGNNGTGSVAYDLYAGNNYISKIPDHDDIFRNHRLYGAAYQPVTGINAEVMLVGASAFKIMPEAFDQGTTVTAETGYPSILDVQFFKTGDAGQTSRLNTQVNVDDTYTFYTEVNYSSGGVDKLFDGTNDTAINIVAWYDDAGASELTVPPEDASHRTRMFNATWYEGDGGITPQNAILNYPAASPGGDEFTIMGFDSGPAGVDQWWIEVEIYFGFQVRAADGNGFGNGASTNESDPAQSFNDPNSWNFKVNVYDIIAPTASNTRYEEFGIFSYTNVTVSGNPAGNAPPGMTDYALGGGSQITYSTNTDYFVNVSVPNLDRIGGGGSILANNVNVSISSTLANNSNSQINSSWGPAGRAFPGADTPLGVWGNASQVDWDIDAPRNGTTAHGPWGSDFNGWGATTVQWYISVPASTAEGAYRAKITFTIGYY